MSFEKKLFGTDGIRGVANQYPMTGEIAFRVGRATAYVLKQCSGKAKIVIGKDTRLSGYMIESALTSGICSMGIDVLLTGPIPTTAVAFLTKHLLCDAGMVISASHNPAEDNGIKIFNSLGQKLSDSLEMEIEELVLNDSIDTIRPTCSDIGKAYKLNEARDIYEDFLLSTMPSDSPLKDLKVVVDCANGAAYRTAPEILRRLGATVIPLFTEPDGNNINLNCGALHPEALCETVVREEADFGLALDGDADRAILCDEKGSVLDGDHILAICGKHYADIGKLNGSSIVTTIMANIGLDLAFKKLGLRLLKTQVGDRYVTEAMNESGSPLGGEQSGHVIFSDWFHAGDGTLTALRVLEVMKSTGKSLSQLASVLKKFPQILVNVPISRKEDIMVIPAIREAIEKAELDLNDQGRVLVRYSGTQPLVRVMVEGPDEITIRQISQSIASLIHENLNNC